MSGRVVFGLTVGLAVLVFTLFPQIDLWVSGLFYRSDTGFFLADWAPVRLLRGAVPLITIAVLVFGAACLVARLLGRSSLVGCNFRVAIYLVVSLAVGPGLVANTILKDHWGRARPSQVTQFGGNRDFTAALVPATQCERNCSFVAGDPALGFYLVSFAFLVPTPRRRRLAEAAALGVGAVLGFVRIAQGGHFFSDVVFAGLVVYASSYLLHRLIVANGFPAPGLVDRLAPALRGPPLRRVLVWSALTAVAVIVSIVFLDRPIAQFFHAQSETLHRVFRFITQFGLAKWYLVGAAALWAGLHLAARLPRFAARALRLDAYSYLPLFFFATVAAPGLVVDVLKGVFGRARPKLLFADGGYGFFFWSARADYWSFPSGHTANAVAIALALVAIWPRFLPLYVVFALLIAMSRIIITAHYLSDVIMGAYVGVLVGGYVAFVFERSGISIAAAKSGVLPPRPALAWRERLGLTYGDAKGSISPPRHQDTKNDPALSAEE
jgi:lipid A 4'-phosphatase